MIRKSRFPIRDTLANSFQERGPSPSKLHNTAYPKFHHSTPTNIFHSRIQTAIQRYSAKRRFDSRRKELFDKYLTYGGVDSGPKMFGGGMDVDTLESSNTREIAALGAHNFVSEDKEPSPESHYVVDFDGVLKGFL